MSQLGFWQLLLGDRVEAWEVRRIQRQLESLPDGGGPTPVENLHARIDALGREVVMLRTAMTVLTSTLTRAGVVDAATLDAAFDAAMMAAELDAPTEPPATSGPARQLPPELASTRYVCIKCRQSVPATSTSMTADGPRCDVCPDPTTPYR